MYYREAKYAIRPVKDNFYLIIAQQVNIRKTVDLKGSFQEARSSRRVANPMTGKSSSYKLEKTVIF